MKRSYDKLSTSNNICEIWNNPYVYLVERVHLTVWELISKMREDRAEISEKELCEGILSPKKRKFGNIAERLRNVCSWVTDNEISVE